MKIILAEDSILLKNGLENILQNAGHQILDSVSNAKDLINSVDKNLPDLVITDVRMPKSAEDNTGENSSGIEAALFLRKKYKDLPILVLSQYIATVYAEQLLESGGAVGYLLKERVGRISSFLQTMDLIAKGGVSFDPEVIAKLFQNKRNISEIKSLTSRETEVLELVARGADNKQIANDLFISDVSVAKHIANIFLKLGLKPDETNKRVRAVLKYLSFSS